MDSQPISGGVEPWLRCGPNVDATLLLLGREPSQAISAPIKTSSNSLTYNSFNSGTPHIL